MTTKLDGEIFPWLVMHMSAFMSESYVRSCTETNSTTPLITTDYNIYFPAASGAQPR